MLHQPPRPSRLISSDQLQRRRVAYWRNIEIESPKTVLHGIVSLFGMAHRCDLDLAVPRFWLRRAHMSAVIAELDAGTSRAAASWARAAEDVALACMSRSHQEREVRPYVHARYIHTCIALDIERLLPSPTVDIHALYLGAYSEATHHHEADLHELCAHLCIQASKVPSRDRASSTRGGR